MKRITLNLLGGLTVCLAFNLQFSTAFAQGAAHPMVTITNPTPAADDNFGWSAVAVGTDRVLVGAHRDDTGATEAGAAYLFSLNGVLLTTFTNPTPAIGDFFGYSVAALGTNRVVIGARFDNTGASAAGAAYLFSTDGALLTTFTNPTPAANDWFGHTAVAVGTDKILIGAHGDDTGATDAGTAYLFSTNGTLLTTFTNPTPENLDYFAISAAAMGADRVLIGAHFNNTGAIDAGTAYLFSTQGTLLMTFTNPAPAAADFFGISVAAVGTDRVLIGAHFDDTAANDSGAAYLFSTNGSLLTTFTNPMPAASEWFGRSVAAVGSDRVLIGSPFVDVGATNAGTAFLFSTSGTLLTTFTNPTPATDDVFGYFVTAIGTDEVLIGAHGDDTGATDAGAVYLFSIAPSLNIRLTTTNAVAVSWPSPWTDWALQENTNGVASVNWSNATGTIQDDGTNMTLIVNPPTGNRFYRLFKP